MRYLVTGGAGFIGSHLVDLLVAGGHRVTVLDDLSTGRSSNLANARKTGNCTLHKGTTSDRRLVTKLVQASDRVFHLASPVGVMRVLRDPVGTLSSILQGGAVILEACSWYRKPVLLASSSEVYGTMPPIPTPEDVPTVLGPPDSPRWHYAAGKMANEHQAMACWQAARLPIVIARLFNVAGPRQTGQHGMVLPRFVRQALRGEPVTVFGHGLQTRCFCHVADAVMQLARLLNNPEAAGQVVNVGSDENVSVFELAKRVIEATGSRSGIEHVAPQDAYYGHRFAEVARRVPDLTKQRRLTGIGCQHGLAEIIRDVIKHETANMEFTV